MKPITVRHIPKDVAVELRRRARQARASLSRTVVQLLQEATGRGSPAKRPSRHHDLDDLAGPWSDEEATAFEAALQDQRTVDPEMWK